MGLPFLLPDKARSNNYPCPWYDPCTVKHCFVIPRTGRVGHCFFFANRPNKKGLLVLIKVKRAQQFGDGSAGRVLFVGNAKTQVGCDCEPGKQECKRSRLACPKNSCYGQRRSAGLQGRDQGQGNGHNTSAVRRSCGAQLLTEAGGLGTIPRGIGRRQ